MTMLERSKTYIARRKPIIMMAERVTEQQVIETWEGARTAYPGDYIMTGVEGERWPVAAESFAQLYDVLEESTGGRTLRVRKKVRYVPVYQTYRALDFEIRDENFHAEPGYFIVYYGEGDIYPCAPDVFFETFDLIRPARPDEEFELPA